MSRAQGSLEYMVIIAAVLAITAVTVLFLSGVFSSQSSTVPVAACKQASQTCTLSRMSSPNDPCLNCITACANPATLKEVAYQATYCCTHEQPENIYVNSPGCNAPTITLFSEQFSSLSAWTGDTSKWYVSLTSGHGDTTSAYKDAYGAHVIAHAQSTVDVSNIQVSFWAVNNLRDSGEVLRLEWSGDGGNTWTLMPNLPRVYPIPSPAPPSAWRYYSYSLPASASNNPQFAIRFNCYDWHQSWEGWDWCQVDDVKINGTAMR